MDGPLAYAKQIAYSSEAVLLFTYEMAKKYCSYEGCFVESGVAAGAQIIAMVQGCPSKSVFAFDSFEGLPLPSNRDNQMPGIMMLTETQQKMLPDPGKQVLETTGAVSVSLEDFWKNIHMADCPSGSIFPVVGWFENTVIGFDKPIAILRLDGDLYNSTWVCLQHLFEKVIKGGCVIVDDWTLPGCQAACKEYFELIGYEPDYKFLDGTSYFFK